ncbi:ABC transporter permease [Clostridium estertheticum]|uniref:ABC transporter permease subunit n=1 Tax=Clostridium estertheticum TaxID=238834 RepID=UPI0013E921DC|nr:ABC transporter permease [Clostridium estertheticum]MBZ9686637.1 ABC transporter permease [Clostridium estertheticum]
MAQINKFIKNFGWARIIIAIFLLILFIIAPIFGVRVDTSLNDVIVRFGMSGIMVLSMVPMIQSGCGLNFGVPVGLISGMMGAVVSLEFNLTGMAGIGVAILVGLAMAAVLGFLYGLLLNRVKGDEMIIATYVGFSFIFLMNIMWLKLPFKNPASVMGFKGEGLRTTISIEEYWIHVLSDILKIPVSKYLIIPTGMILFFIIMCLIVWGFFKTKLGTAITAVGSNPDYARASGININKMRVVSVMLSTMIAAVGMIAFEQGFGFVQMYNGPSAFVFPSVAAVLLGGASVNKATITNVVIGTFLFQGILTMTPSVINSAINIDVSEIIRIIVSNGLIVYALTRKGR